MDPYSPHFDPASVPPATIAAWRQHRFEATFSVALVLLVHLLTLGTASPFLLGRKYAFLPRIRPDDFFTAKAIGFLFIPFYALYWVFVLCGRIVNRLRLQGLLWGVPNAPSKQLASILAGGWVLGAIPYVNMVVWFPLYLLLWPIFLVQVQRFCNALALAAAPDDARPAMLALERATRWRWIGWMLVAPCLALVVTSVVTGVVVMPQRIPELVVGVAFFLALAGGGAALIAVGTRRAQGVQGDLEAIAPTILAAYLRIDKNAAWCLTWIAGILSVAFVMAGFATVHAPEPTTPPQEGWPSVALGTILGVGAAYAATRALQLKQEIARLTEEW